MSLAACVGAAVLLCFVAGTSKVILTWHLILIIMSMTPDLHNWWHQTRAFIFGEIDCFAQIGLYAGTACLGFFISWQVLIWNHPLVDLSLNQISHFFRLFQIVVRRLLLLGGEEVQHNREGEKIFIGTATTIVLEISSISIIYIALKLYEVKKLKLY